ncbi:lantibiotic dehydratase [Catenulispora rubra]|uniref:lantibiotic dehydratase n=1 Tax=Catenulispora rubra TaxID=280293 RepID=UPI001892354E|nr:lantibiotic dehydratase [Catenulispora rubra]
MTVTMPFAGLTDATDAGDATGATGLAGTATDSGAAGSWELGRRFMLRVAGLPFSALESLRSPASVAWADAVLDGERRLAESGAALSDLLHEAISDNEDEADRRALLGLRRQVFNAKPVKDPEAALRLPMSDGCRDALAGWLREHAAWQELRAQGSAILRTEDAQVRETLRQLAAEPRLRQGLLLASPSLDAALDGFLAKPPGELGKRDRRTQRALVEYLYKVAGKTSPFSSFTGVALGEFTDMPGAASASGPDSIAVPDDWTDHPRINVAVLARLADLVAADDALRADLPVTLTAGWHAEEDRLRYMRHTTVRGDDDAAVSFDIVQDDLFFLRHGAALQGILDVLAGEPGLRYSEFISRLSSAVQAPAADCDAYARRLMQLGLLRVPALRIDIHHRDPLRDLAGRLLTLERPWADELSARLEGIAMLLDGFADADLAARRAILQRIRTGFEEVHEALGAPEATLPRTLVYEDVRAGQAPVVCDRSEWTASFGGPLRTLSEVLPLFDMVLTHRLVLRGFFLARYGVGGRCEDVAGFVRDFHEDIYDQYVRLTQERRSFDEDGGYLPYENWLRQPEFGVLDAAREAFAEHMRELWRGRESSESEDEVVLSEAVLAEIAGRIAPFTSRFRPEAHFLQVGRTDSGPIAALNRSFGGLHFPFSRFSHCFEDVGAEGLSGELRQTSGMVAPDGAVLAEVAGGIVGTNLNLHGLLTEYQIICPDEHSSLPAEAQLPMDDLFLEHDVDSDRVMLRSRRLGREVVPVYLGYLLPMVLPAIPRFLLLFSPSSLARLDVWEGVPGFESGLESGLESAEGVRTRPRVRLGSLIVARRQWTFPASTLPAHQSGADSTERLLAWRRWQLEHRLPDQVFARCDAEGERAKPALVDFTSTVSLSLLDAALKDGGFRLEEMSPGADQLTVMSGPEHGRTPGHHVAELAVETTVRRSHPTFTGGTS